MGNKTIGIDFDCTLVNSICAFVETYKQNHQDELKASVIPFPMWEFVHTWNMRECEIPFLTEAELYDIFASESFFEKLFPYRDTNGVSMFDFLHEINDDYRDIAIVSSGCSRNLQLKREWINKNIPIVKDKFIGIEKEKGKKLNKESFTGLMLIDDNQDALMSANVKYRILANLHYTKETDWNKDVLNRSDVYVCNSVSETIDTVVKLLEFERVR